MTDIEPCPLCGALPVDWDENPHDAEVGLCWTLANIREAMGVHEKPMMNELAPMIADMRKVLLAVYASWSMNKAGLPQSVLDDLTAVLACLGGEA